MARLSTPSSATRRFTEVNAGIAQLVEQLICNQQVVGSNPTAGSFHFRIAEFDCGLIRQPRFFDVGIQTRIWLDSRTLFRQNP